jgi:D-alanyl-D-alanine carboxypeptidase/D-alanyl-D-alanine-endopeptidase (penicillin-binding protein 4)
VEELKPRRHRAAAAVAVAVVAVLGAGAVLAGASTRDPDAAGAAAIAAASTGAILNEPAADSVPARPVPTTSADARTLRSCSVAALAADPRLGDFQAQVVNAGTGEVLFDRGGDTSSRTASVLKVLTSAAALEVLGPDYRATTTVVAGSTPGSVVLVGGGDLTLTRLPTGTESVYPGAAHVDDLARQTLAAWQANQANPPITSLVLDASFFGGPGWEPSWDDLERTAGSMPEVTGLAVDGDRDDPSRNSSSRSTDPVGRAGAAFAAALGGGVSVSLGTAPAGAVQLAAARSQPVSVLIGQSLIVSDNTLAEMLARLVAVESGAGNTFGALQQSVVAALDAYGIDTTGIVIRDGSGLSDDNAVPPSYLTRLFVKINAREGDLGVIFDGLPVAGGPIGSLSYSDRFTGENAIADGAVFAKTGWIDTGYTLSGIIRAADGTPLTFAVYALGDVSDNAKQALDTITAGFFRCGDNLSNS